MDVLKLKKLAATVIAVALGAIIICTGLFPVYAVASESGSIATPAQRAISLILKSNADAGGVIPATSQSSITAFDKVSSDITHEQTNAVVEVEHSFVATEVSEPTCSENGYTLYTCKYCGQSYKGSLVACLPHRFVANVVEPACTHRGYTTYSCTECAFAFLDPDSYLDETDHSYVKTVISPTCDAEGCTVNTCAICGDEYVDNITPALGHDFSELITEGTPSQCQYPGVGPVYGCSRCDATKGGEETAPLGHDIEDITYPPTCEGIGYIYHVCTRCNQGYFDSVMAPLGHNYEDRVVEPRCTEGGYTITACTQCGNFTVSNSLPALGHRYTSKTINANCPDGGYIEYVCENCNNVYTEVVDPSEHEYVEEVVAPTCTEPGYTSHTCINCGHSYLDNEVEALGHDYETSITQPTCTAGGFTTHTCKNCGYSFVDQKVEAIGHSWGEPTWIWSSDFLSATLTFKCQNDSAHIRSIRANVESETVDTTTTYIATVTIDGMDYSDERSVIVIVTDPVRDPVPGNNQGNNSSNNANNSNGGGTVVDDPISSGDGDDPSNSDSDSSHANDDSQGVTAAVIAQPISVSAGDAKSDGINAIITNAPKGTKELSVASVEEGHVFNALATAVADDIVKEESDAEIAGVYDVKLSIDGTNYAQSFGKLTLEFPVDEKYNMHWAKIYHCHNNDTSNITTFEKVIAMDGKVVLSGVTRLSMFAVAMGELVEQNSPRFNDIDVPDVAELVQLNENGSTFAATNSTTNRSSAVRGSVTPTLSVSNRASSTDGSQAHTVDIPAQEAVVSDGGEQSAEVSDPVSPQLRQDAPSSDINTAAPSISSTIESAMNTPVATVSGVKISLFQVGIVTAVILLAAASAILVLYFRKRRA